MTPTERYNLEHYTFLQPKDIAEKLNVSLTTGKKKFSQMASEYPGAIITIRNEMIKGVVYGPRKPAQVVLESDFDNWYQKQKDHRTIKKLPEKEAIDNDSAEFHKYDNYSRKQLVKKLIEIQQIINL